MVWQIRDITLRSDRAYDVLLNDESGGEERVVCRVVSHKGVLGVRVEPDILMGREPPRMDSREFVQAVLDFHNRHAG